MFIARTNPQPQRRSGRGEIDASDWRQAINWAEQLVGLNVRDDLSKGRFVDDLEPAFTEAGVQRGSALVFGKRSEILPLADCVMRQL